MGITITCHLVGEMPEVGKQIKVQITDIGGISRRLPDRCKEPTLTGRILKVYKNGNFDVRDGFGGTNKYKVINPKLPSKETE